MVLRLLEILPFYHTFFFRMTTFYSFEQQCQWDFGDGTYSFNLWGNFRTSGRFAKIKNLLYINILQNNQDYEANIFGVRQVLGTGKYLGVPFMIGRNIKGNFNFVKD